MAHLWQSTQAGEWHPIALDCEAFALNTDAIPPDDQVSARRLVLVPLRKDTTDILDGEVPWDAETEVVIRRSASADDDSWILLARPDVPVLVNGLTVDLGIIVVTDRDEIRWPSWPPLYFSTERLAAAAPYPATAHGLCPRCKDPIGVGHRAVCCPGCGLWHHASEERPCWTYGDRCAACAQLTALDTGFRWTPEEL